MTEHTPARLVRIEAEALLALAARLEGPMAADFERAVELVLQCGQARGRVVVTGMGKSGIIAQKIAATLSSTGLTRIVSSPGRGAAWRPGRTRRRRRGDRTLGQRRNRRDPAATRHLKRIGNALISFCCDQKSTLALASDIALDCSVEQEACGLGLAPTASTTAMLALGDALAIAVSLRKGFREEDFADLHPGGKLGKKLARVRQLMHSGEAVPRVSGDTPMAEVIYEMSRQGLGMTTVVDHDRLIGLISDGDLRRLLQRRDPRRSTAPPGKP